jgi:hypothetical protein
MDFENLKSPDGLTVGVVMSTFRKYIQFIEDNFTTHINNLDNEINGVNFSNDGTDQEMMKLINYVEIDHFFKDWFRASIVIQLFGFLEINLVRYCDAHKVSNNKEYSLGDLRGNNELDKITKYLKQSADKNIKGYSHWPFIDNLRKLRNALVHKEAFINKADSDFASIKQFSKNRFFLQELESGSYSHRIIVGDNAFLLECCDEVQAFLSEVFINK